MTTFKQAVLFATVGLCFSVTSFAAGGALTKEEYKAEQDRIQADYKAAKERCDSLRDSTKDVCDKEAKSNEKIAKADLEARNQNTESARRDALTSKAEAEFAVAKEKCRGLGEDCVNDARAVERRAKADAKIAD